VWDREQVRTSWPWTSGCVSKKGRDTVAIGKTSPSRARFAGMRASKIRHVKGKNEAAG
jgi:hypothetical protein